MASITYHLGIIGLGTMGANIARNAARKGMQVCVFNRTRERSEQFLAQHGSEGTFNFASSLAQFVECLHPPRTILLMVKAGEAVEEILSDLLPLLTAGDIVIDGGNSRYSDTEARMRKAKRKNVHVLGMGISGGEEGALLGPSLMPGGDEAAYRRIEPLFQSIAADDGQGGKCIVYLGPGGSGHFVKMVHNGIEYGLMQLLAESYDLLRSQEGATHEDILSVFREWRDDPRLASFLLEVTVKVLEKKDEESGQWLLSLMKDSAQQKGTGRWTLAEAAELGTAVPTIAAAVEARVLSGDPARQRWQRDWKPMLSEPYPDSKTLPELLRSALELSMICAYLQGFSLLSRASDKWKWNMNVSEVARIWRGGCVIRSALLPIFQKWYSAEEGERQEGRALLFEPFQGEAQTDWRRLIAIAAGQGIPIPAFSASLAYFDTLRSPRLPQNLIQAQRDAFGAHGFERTDREGMFHAQWE